MNPDYRSLAQSMRADLIANLQMAKSLNSRTHLILKAIEHLESAMLSRNNDDAYANLEKAITSCFE